MLVVNFHHFTFTHEKNKRIIHNSHPTTSCHTHTLHTEISLCQTFTNITFLLRYFFSLSPSLSLFLSVTLVNYACDAILFNASVCNYFQQVEAKLALPLFIQFYSVFKVSRQFDHRQSIQRKSKCLYGR